MKKVLILNGQYLPGYKGGGPIQSCVNMVENLADKYEFLILCADRDYKVEQPYSNVAINQWNQVGSAKVFYMSPEMQSFKGFEKILNETEYDILYLNGFFSPIYTIRPLVLRRLGRLKKTKVILTPRGDFTGGCENKKIKKYSFIYVSKAVGLYRKLLWHATSEIEANDIKKKYPHAEIFMVPNLPARFVPKERITPKKEGELRIVFVSRIFPKKNLKYALEIMKQIKNGNIVFDIYGPMEDTAYWAECEKVIAELPSNVKVSYCGEAEHEQIPHIFEQYHVFFFPTLGENYGHVIVEAMMNNCLCLLSKGVTPWDDYSACGSLVCSLDQRDDFERSVNDLIMMDDNEFAEHVQLNNQYIAGKVDNAEAVHQYVKMLCGE